MEPVKFNLTSMRLWLLVMGIVYPLGMLILTGYLSSGPLALGPALAALALTWILFITMWDTLSLYLQYAWLLALLALLLFKQDWLAIALVVGAWLLLEWRVRRNVGQPGLDLASPCPRRLSVGQGGHSRLVNYHGLKAPTQAYALDLAVIDALGRRTSGFSLFPRPLTAYHSFGQPVLSPIDGIVLNCENRLPDQPIGSTDPQRPLGNYVLMRSAARPEVHLLVAHLQQGSVAVRPGQEVRVGDYLGRIGNSGNTSEPHIHLHAERAINGQWQAVPITINGKRLRRNSIIPGRPVPLFPARRSSFVPLPERENRSREAG
ncbi:M23 family metallopeptidase [Thermogemmatispora onikobensis]|uniref:M23 family metallopeptidase n=1 Tax=Thermogemmatispora onikobensis TaxID=732234 RepID=UPI0008534CC2|nr:M23 family metallopeptidase [Thermogemmatispora onikobensis]